MSTDADMDFTDYEEQIQPWIKNQATSNKLDKGYRI